MLGRSLGNKENRPDTRRDANRQVTSLGQGQGRFSICRDRYNYMRNCRELRKLIEVSSIAAAHLRCRDFMIRSRPNVDLRSVARREAGGELPGPNLRTMRGIA